MELKEDRTWEQWIVIIREALSCLDLKTHNWIHLPEKGGYYDQDENIMSIWNIIRNEVCNAMKDTEFQKSLEVKYGKSST